MMSYVQNEEEQQILDDVKTRLAAMFAGKDFSPAGHHESTPYYRLGDLENGYYVLVSAGEVEYIVRYRTIRITETCQGQQIYLMRVSSSWACGFFARHVAFNLLLPQYHLLVSECQDTRTGKSFWGYSAEYAFERNLHVYFWAKEANVWNELASLDTDKSELNKQQWQNFHAHQYRFWAISDHAVS